MSSENLSADTGTGIDKTAAENSKLLTFDDNKVSTGNDINNKITALDTDLAQLRMELGTINNSVEEGLDRLGDTDTDLTAKVSETYKRLGEIDNAYKSLLEISSRIDRDIQKLNGDVSSVAEQSATGIKTLEQSTIAQSNEFTQKNQQVVSRVSQLVETSKLTSELLGQKIQATTDTILQIEKRVVSEIEHLSTSTREKTDAIESAVDNTRARIIKLQSVDEAIIRRATTLEISSAELTVASQHLGASVDQLELSSEMLSHGIDNLKSRTDALETLTASQGTLIGGLQKTAADISDRLALLAGREGRHFNIITAAFLLLVIATGVLYFSQQEQMLERDVFVDNRVDGLQQALTGSDVLTNESLAVLNDKIELVNASMQEELKKEIAQVDFNMQEVADQVQSVEGRLNESSPFSQIGDDNIIHSAQRINALPKENFTVQLALTHDKNLMYEIAQRYNFYLKDSLFYFEVADENAVRYALLSGNYTTKKQALAAIDEMPKYIDMQQPVLRDLESIQEYIAR